MVAIRMSAEDKEHGRQQELEVERVGRYLNRTHLVKSGSLHLCNSVEVMHRRPADYIRRETLSAVQSYE